MDTVAELIVDRAEGPGVALRFEEASWSFPEYFDEAVARGRLLLDLKPTNSPFHVGVLLENVPDYAFLLGGAALAGATIVGINPTRRGSELERDIRHTECAVLITEEKLAPLLDGLETGVAADATFVVESERWQEAVAENLGMAAPAVEIDPVAPYLLIFTSGTSGDPKATICSQSRLASILPMIAERRGITPDDTIYCAMPMFHGNGIMSGWGAALAGGATLALRRRFSASQFLADVRRYNATLANYVGKVLTYVLATPEQPDDSDNLLRFVYGNEGTPQDLERFAARFDCRVSDSYGSSEGGVTIFRVPEQPTTALGMGAEGTVVLDPETGVEKERALFDGDGHLLNPDSALGELASTLGAKEFEGYWKNPEAQQEKVRDGIFWTGDLGYIDDQGFVYFAGRGMDWMRVDGENVGAVTVERIVMRHPDVAVAAAYAVPDPAVGDQVMVALEMRPGREFDGPDFGAFLDSQDDLGTKARPRFVRVSPGLPMTPTNKVIVRELRGEHWECSDPVWIDGPDAGYVPLEQAERSALTAAVVESGRGHLLGGRLMTGGKDSD